MRSHRQLPAAPDASIEVLGDETVDPGGFLRRHRHQLRALRPGHEPTPAFPYDQVSRRAIDAVVVVPFVRGAEGPEVVLIASLRPPAGLRPPGATPTGEPEWRFFWEVPAGLVEPAEMTASGLARAAARELLEETGFRVEPAALEQLGPSVFPCPGVIAERQYFFVVEVHPEHRETPPLDGSVLESVAELIQVPLAGLLAAIRDGRLPDSKTELALRRFADWGAARGWGGAPAEGRGARSGGGA